ncbi:polyprenol reductase [Ischnura elegans]|uniref:polyprenol reductase n=1 Tax=Ischnura elegans TaxID=197161 RepID=UPI001ED871EC|nr:polyprenol reductase [Ischnura elegans]
MYILIDRDISLVKLFFGSLTLGVLIVAILVNALKKRLPKVITDMYNYGKFLDNDVSFFIVTVPKRWFRHFYVVGVFCTGIVFMIMLNVCCFGGQPSTTFLSFLNVVAATNTKPTGAAVNALLAISLLLMHCIGRFIETHFISVFSDSKMNFIQYTCGIIHYVGASLAIVAESPGFSNLEPCSFSWDELTVFDYSAALILCLACYEQIKSSIILANLRKNKKGSVCTYKHSIPRGRLFEILSSPHISAEIVVYLALTFILRGNCTWWYIFIWVLTNQCAVSWTNHVWYQQNFPTYPKNRKALIPYLL